ncbi:MAG: 4'-phosphopantetheinyl transferase superfamily protein [Actinomycetota bacterium]|nr:4'-phosphopantetheinyl transferase superfamily protein [Actinomycetota bacterium]
MTAPASRIVDVWHARADAVSEADYAALAGTLCEEERRRAHAFAFAADRRRFTVAHGLLRVLLADRADCTPEALRFTAGPAGKPALQPPVDDLHFSLSHGGDELLIAVTRGMLVGVDIEPLARKVAWQELARRTFAPSEHVALLALPPELRETAFLTCWTRKEAYVKARGEGLGRGLGTFSVAVDPRQRAALLSDDADPSAPACWELHGLELGSDACAALAVECNGSQIRVHRISRGSRHCLLGPRHGARSGTGRVVG